MESQGQSIVSVPSQAELVAEIAGRAGQSAGEKTLVVCGKHTKDELLDAMFGDCPFERFSAFSPNPSIEQVSAATKAYGLGSCARLLAVGGGSAIDVAKAVKWMLYQAGMAPKDLPELWAIPTTAGTGSESTPFAVVYSDGKKQSLDEPWLLPNAAFLCGELILSVPAYHRNAAFMDAFCQATESWWSASATPESVALSKRAIRLLLEYACDYVEPQVDFIEVQQRAGLDDAARLEAAQRTLEAANCAGQAIATTRTTAAHAMSYALTSDFGYAHGHAVALCFWQVVKVHALIAAMDASCRPELRTMLNDLCDLLDVDSMEDLWQFAEGLVRYLGFEFPDISREQAEDLAQRVNLQRLSNNPVELTHVSIAQMYLDMVQPEPTAEAEAQLRTNQFHTARMGRWLLQHRANWDDIKVIQNYSINVLRDVDRCCQDLGIEYFMAEGALLGALRHGGPIPWDDDIDIGLLRADYDRFVREAPDYFGGKYVVDTYETNPKHWTISGKVQMADSVGFMRLKTEGLSLSNAPFVDLFAFDESPTGPSDNPDPAKPERLLRLTLRGRYISGLRRLLFYKTGFSTNPKRKKRAQQVITRFTPVSWLHKRIDKACRKYQGKGCRYVTNFGSMYKARKETFPVEWISPTKRVSYGDMQVSVPNEAERVLERIYGDWRQMPPYKARRGKHGFVRKGNFKHERSKHEERVREKAAFKRSEQGREAEKEKRRRKREREQRQKEAERVRAAVLDHLRKQAVN